jgi:hypothetical protein
MAIFQAKSSLRSLARRLHLPGKAPWCAPFPENEDEAYVDWVVQVSCPGVLAPHGGRAVGRERLQRGGEDLQRRELRVHGQELQRHLRGRELQLLL